MAVKTLLVLLTDSLATFHRKGEIRSRYYNPGDFFDEVHFASPAREEIDSREVQALAGRARLVVHPLGPYSLGGWRASSPLGRVVREVRPDVIRAYDPALRGALAVTWGRRTRVPSFVSIHADLDEQRSHERRPAHYLRLLAENYTLPRARVVSCVTEHVAAYARRHGARDPHVIYNRVDLAQFRPAPAPRRSGRVRVVSVGRMVPQKDPACLVRALREVDAELVLIGDGPDRARVEQTARQVGVADRVVFVPAVAHRDIGQQYRDADIFAIATHYEGFCIPVLEAMASGLPVVATRIPPIAEIVGDAGVLVEHDAGAMAAALKALIASPTRRAEIGARAVARAATLDGAVMEQRERDVYASLVAPSRR